MTIEKYNKDLTQALKWLQNDAPNIQGLVTKKDTWVKAYNDQFWDDWEANVFNLSTCNAFGLMIWCIILGCKSDLFNLAPAYDVWAFGDKRQNFKSTNFPVQPEDNTIGGNFAGADAGLRNLDEIRLVLKFRYLTLVSNGRIQYINKILQYILNDGEPWDYSKGNYAYVVDATSTSTGDAVTSTISLVDWQGTAVAAAAAIYGVNYDLDPDGISAYFGTTAFATPDLNPITGTNAPVIASNTANAQHFANLYQFSFSGDGSGTLFTETEYNLSVYLKNEGSTRVQVGVKNNATATSTFIAGTSVRINWADNTCVAVDGVSFSWTLVSAGWYRLSISWTPPADTPANSAYQLSVQFINSSLALSYTGVATDKIAAGWSMIVAGDLPVWNTADTRVGIDASVPYSNLNPNSTFNNWISTNVYDGQKIAAPNGVISDVRSFFQTSTPISDFSMLNSSLPTIVSFIIEQLGYSYKLQQGTGYLYPDFTGEWALSGTASGAALGRYEPEIASENLFLWSDNLTESVWSKSNLTTSYDHSVIGIYGFGNSLIMKPSTAALATHGVSQSLSTPALSPVTLSAIVKAGSGYSRVALSAVGNMTATIPTIIADLIAGTISPSGTDYTTEIAPLGDGWFNISLSYTSNSNTSVTASLIVVDGANNTVFTADGLGFVRFQHLQYEASSFGTSPIYSSSVIGTRLATSAEITAGSTSISARVDYSDGTSYTTPLSGSTPAEIPLASKIFGYRFITNIRILSESGQNVHAAQSVPLGHVSTSQNLAAETYLKPWGVKKIRCKLAYTPASGTMKDIHVDITFDSLGNVVSTVNSSDALSNIINVTGVNGDIWTRVVLGGSDATIASSSSRYIMINMLDDNGNINFNADPSKGMYLYGFGLFEALPANINYLPVPSQTSTPTISVESVSGMNVVIKFPSSIIPNSGQSVVATFTGGYFPTGFQQNIGTGDGVEDTFDFTMIPYRAAAVGTMAYYFGSKVNISEQTLSYMADRSNGLLPACGGIPYTVTKDS